MPNISVSAVGGALPAWLPTAGDAARSILHTVTRHLDGLRNDVERELIEHARCRRDVEALIDRLISGLDEVDGDVDLEDFNEGDTLDEHGELDLAECEGGTTPETYGRGWDAAAAQAGKGESLFADAVRPALFISWKAGRCTSAAFVPSEGRARA